MNCAWVAQIIRDHPYIDAVFRAQVGGERLQAILTARGQHQVATTRGELPREFGADAGGRAGDEGSVTVRGCH
jgi:hypothetical protein